MFIPFSCCSTANSELNFTPREAGFMANELLFTIKGYRQFADRFCELLLDVGSDFGSVWTPPSINRRANETNLH